MLKKRSLSRRIVKDGNNRLIKERHFIIRAPSTVQNGTLGLNDLFSVRIKKTWSHPNVMTQVAQARTEGSVYMNLLTRPFL